MAYHLHELDTDYYAVTLLSYITLTTTGGKSKDGFYAGTQLVKWVGTKAGGDWKLTQGTNDDVRKVLDADRPKPAAPGTGRSSPRAGSSSTRSSREQPGRSLAASLRRSCSPGCSALRS